MFFFFKRKKIVLDCFTNRQQLVDLFPIEKTSKHFPEWWKQLPSHYDNGVVGPRPTMRKCAGFTEFHSESFCIPLWSDLSVTWNNDEQSKQTKFRWEFSDAITKIDIHDTSQRGEYLNHKNYQHLKIESEWFFKCKEEIKWLFTQNTWAFENPEKCIVFPGILEFKYQHGTNINFALPFDKKENGKLFIESGTPMVSIFPLTDREVIVKNHCVGKEEMKKLEERSNSVSFIGKYNKIKRLYKEKEKEQKKCPFHFGK